MSKRTPFPNFNQVTKYKIKDSKRKFKSYLYEKSKCFVSPVFYLKQVFHLPHIFLLVNFLNLAKQKCSGESSGVRGKSSHERGNPPTSQRNPYSSLPNGTVKNDSKFNTTHMYFNLYVTFYLQKLFS